MLTAWLKVYGEANNLPGLATGPIEARFHRLRESASADEMVIWTTPERRAAGAGPQIRIPALHFDLACRFADGHIVAEGLSQMSADAREPQRERGSVGVVMTVGRIELPPEGDRPDPLAVEIEAIFDRLTENRWKGFVTPLREALEAEARDDAERAERLATPYLKAEPRQGGRGQESPFRLSGLTVSGAAGFDDGEWLDLMNERGMAIATARLIHVDVGAGTMDVDVRGADPPVPGIVRPRPRVRIIDQKRAILDELESPRGNLPLVARLMASPAAMPIPRPTYPAQFLNLNVGRSRAQGRAVALALGLAEGEALLIEGPPGTGKSTTTGEIVAQVITRDPQARILVCSHSNHGTDNMLMKVVPYLEKCPGLMPARVGMFDRVSPELRRYYVTPDEDLSDRNVIFTTIDALALNDAAGGSVYDYVVLDEANRATVLDSLIALTRGKRFIMVGDRLQLQPVLSEAEEQLRLEPALARAGVIGKSLFVWLTERHFPDRAVVFLDEQNRMHPVIGGLIARAFYEDRLRNGPAAPRRETGVPHFPQPAVWVDTRGLRGLKESRGRGPSLFNLPEARLVTTIARHLLRNAPEGMDLGVIAAYAEQSALLRRLLRNDGRVPGRKLEIDTVDAFEGREKDIIVVSLVRSNKRREIGFLNLMQRINVALSRARRLLIVVGDTATLRGSYFDRILRYMRERQSIVPGPRVIAQLRGGEVRPMVNPRERHRPMPGHEGRPVEAPGVRGFRRPLHPGRINPNLGHNFVPGQNRLPAPIEPFVPAPTGDSMPPEIPDFEPVVSSVPPPSEIATENAQSAQTSSEQLLPVIDAAAQAIERRRLRNRRSPAEILARLSGAIQQSGESESIDLSEQSMDDFQYQPYSSVSAAGGDIGASPESTAHADNPMTGRFADSRETDTQREIEYATSSVNPSSTEQPGQPPDAEVQSREMQSGHAEIPLDDAQEVRDTRPSAAPKRKPRPSRARTAAASSAEAPSIPTTAGEWTSDLLPPAVAEAVDVTPMLREAAIEIGFSDSVTSAQPSANEPSARVPDGSILDGSVDIAETGPVTAPASRPPSVAQSPLRRRRPTVRPAEHGSTDSAGDVAPSSIPETSSLDTASNSPISVQGSGKQSESPAKAKFAAVGRALQAAAATAMATRTPRPGTANLSDESDSISEGRAVSDGGPGSEPNEVRAADSMVPVAGEASRSAVLEEQTNSPNTSVPAQIPSNEQIVGSTRRPTPRRSSRAAVSANVEDQVIASVAVPVTPDESSDSQPKVASGALDVANNPTKSSTPENDEQSSLTLSPPLPITISLGSPVPARRRTRSKPAPANQAEPEAVAPASEGTEPSAT